MLMKVIHMYDDNKNWVKPAKRPHIIGCRVTDSEKKEFDELLDYLGFENPSIALRYIIGEFINQNKEAIATVNQGR